MIVEALFIAILAAIIIAWIFFLYSIVSRRKALKEEYGEVPTHTELYFEEYFEDIMEEWDLVTEKEAQKWARDIDDRVTEVAGTIDRLNQTKDEIDQDLETIEDKIEGFEERV
ncbi:MAG: hypothetical protein ACLFSM_00750 [Thermoplasmata archaeon]